MTKPSESPKCTDCKHCHVIRKFTLKEDWMMLFVPPFWIILPVINLFNDPWCSVARSMVGQDLNEGTNCHKMRLGSACGPEAKLFEPREFQ